MNSNGDSEFVYIDPSYAAFYADKLFDLSSPSLNRDDQLLPAVRLRDEARKKGINIKTADFISTDSHLARGGSYYSMGIIPDYSLLVERGIRKRAYILMEPPVVAPKFYDLLPKLTQEFELVYVHNTEGDGYSLDGVRAEALRKFYWPLPYRGVLERYWRRNDREKKIVVINGHHKPLRSFNELYSKRIEAIASFVRYDAIDLYGRGWDNWATRCSLWLPYILNRRSILKAFRGACDSKYETLSRYTFCLCLENMTMKGYITEKIFDCLYAGTIPLYLGAPDISRYIPKDAFVDCRKFENWDQVLSFVRLMTSADIEAMRVAGKAFLENKDLLPYYHSFEDIFGIRP